LFTLSHNGAHYSYNPMTDSFTRDLPAPVSSPCGAAWGNVPPKRPDDPIPDAYCDSCPTKPLEAFDQDDMEAAIVFGRFQEAWTSDDFDRAADVEEELEDLGFRLMFSFGKVDEDDDASVEKVPSL
jgi:hypothetical protein